MKDKLITLNHGSGGRLTGELVRDIFAVKFGMAEPLTDSAMLDRTGSKLAFTTDSYVVDPIFFPGGSIGKLAVCGTVNDLSVTASTPVFISASFIIEEGFPVNELVSIVEDMAAEAEKAGVKIVTGDTKVVGKGKCDRLFITTSGVGYLRHEFENVAGAGQVIPGDVLIVNGPLGNHAVAVLGARKNLGFTIPVKSDVASLNRLIDMILDNFREVHFMRDLTRGGLATVLNELCTMTGLGIRIDEPAIPVDEPVRGLCEMMGFDPLYLANEGKFLLVTSEAESGKILDLMRSDELGKFASIIGRTTRDNPKQAILTTFTGGKRILDNRAGSQLPRIC